ncbi:hypothetical protein CTI12_AA498550 [Artemisia annua]|uniref:Uncharacterized protein n=1 Tax=Artemisia annua TaxID=35608 RepID=A0A2U1LET0_ARTAN|nr:hypothetical protein CTI12_AA498550 [Artemisia annua]
MDTLRQLLAKLGFTSTPSQTTPPVAYTTNTSPVAYTMNNHPYGPAQLQYQSQPLYSAQVFPQGVQGLPQGAGHNVAQGVHGLPQGVQFGVTGLFPQGVHVAQGVPFAAGSQPLQGVQSLSQGVQFAGSQPRVPFGPGVPFKVMKMLSTTFSHYNHPLEGFAQKLLPYISNVQLYLASGNYMPNHSRSYRHPKSVQANIQNFV